MLGFLRKITSPPISSYLLMKPRRTKLFQMIRTHFQTESLDLLGEKGKNGTFQQFACTKTDLILLHKISNPAETLNEGHQC